MDFDEEGFYWDKPGWYFKKGEVDLSQYPMIEEGVGICGLTLPFTTREGVNANYSHLNNNGTQIGFLDSALLCSRPIEKSGSGSFETTENYYCPREKLPFEYKESWGVSTFNPVCTDWFINQRENYRHGTIEQRNLPNYDQSKIITSCMPIILHES